MRDVLLCLAVLGGLVLVLVQLARSGGDGAAIAIVVALIYGFWRLLRSRFVTRR